MEPISEHQHLQLELSQSRLIHLFPNSWYAKYFFWRTKQRYIRYLGWLKNKEIDEERIDRIWNRIQKRIVEGDL
jgi:hypothetical protein